MYLKAEISSIIFIILHILIHHMSVDQMKIRKLRINIFNQSTGLAFWRVNKRNKSVEKS